MDALKGLSRGAFLLGNLVPRNTQLVSQIFDHFGLVKRVHQDFEMRREVHESAFHEEYILETKYQLVNTEVSFTILQVLNKMVYQLLP